MKKQARTKKYILKYTITNNKKGINDFTTYEDAKKVYLALAKNLTIKAVKLYEVNGKKSTLIEKFTKKRIIALNGEEV